MVGRIYRPELQLNKANAYDTEVHFLDLYLSISNGFVSPIIYDKRDDFDFDIVNFPSFFFFFLWMVTLGVLPLTGFMFLNRFNLLEDQSCADLNTRNNILTTIFLQLNYWYHKL